jgi:DNA repair protein SbcD/Mre11
VRFEFLHAADLHLDSPLRGLSAYEGLPADVIRGATRQAFDNLIKLAIERAVAFVILAGDLYDGEWDEFGTGLYFCGAMRRLADAGIDVYFARGNHDAQSVQTRHLPLPPNVHTFRHRAPEHFIHESTRTVLHGQSYKDRDPGRNLAAEYPAAYPGCFNIGVLHTALAGDPNHQPYSPCTPDELAGKGYDYWALGHVHAHRVVSQNPFIVFPGNIQGRHIRETGPKGVVLVTVEDGAVVGLEHIAVDAISWAEVLVLVGAASDLTAVELLIREALAAAYRMQAADRPLVARVVLTDETPLHGLLLQRGDQLRDEIRAIAAAISDTLWIEKVRIETEPPADIGTLVGDEIWAAIADASSDADLRTALASDLASFFSKIPADLVDSNPLLSRARAGEFDSLLANAAESLKARLEEGAA